MVCGLWYFAVRSGLTSRYLADLHPILTPPTATCRALVRRDLLVSGSRLTPAGEATIAALADRPTRLAAAMTDRTGATV
jgi:hypothetical protein